MTRCIETDKPLVFRLHVTLRNDAHNEVAYLWQKTDCWDENDPREKYIHVIYLDITTCNPLVDTMVYPKYSK